MQWINNFFLSLSEFIPSLAVLLVITGVLTIANITLRRRWQDQTGMQFRFQLIMLALTLVGGLSVIISLPISDNLRAQLLSLIGILLSAAIALSSTTFISNILAGIMLRTIKSVHPGDFVTVSNVVGRVTEINLLHTEVQTEDRDLVTVPNMFMVTQPMKVVRASGTIMSADVSLGYDVPRKRIADLLTTAGTNAGLTDVFVHVRELGDFSVTYRTAGLLGEVSSLLSSRSKLREAILDSLHEANIEIVSPGFMNTRALSENIQFIPQPTLSKAAQESKTIATAEELVFDKADAAASVENIRKTIELIDEQVLELGRGDLTSESISRQRTELDNERIRLAALLTAAKERQKINDLELAEPAATNKPL